MRQLRPLMLKIRMSLLILRKISFDDLLLVVGVQPVFPRSIRYDARPFVVNSIDQFTDLYQHIKQKNDNIAVLGAGLVGTEFAYDLSHHVQDVDWIYSEDCRSRGLCPKR